MPTITLADGKVKQFDEAVTGFELAKSISNSLVKQALALNVDGRLVDMSFVIDHDATVAVVTLKDEEGLEILRHSTAHLLAHAVMLLFPKAEVTIGPVIDNGFYYDFGVEQAFAPEDLINIEKKMRELVKRNDVVTREEVTREQAIKLFTGMGQQYKVEIIKDLPEDEVLSIYRQGDFVDLCRGPHVPKVSMLKVFQLTKVAGAYWRGDHKNAMLQRIYGTAWATNDQLNAYLTMLAEAEKRDHRKIGKDLDLFHMQQEAPGMVFWHPKGWQLFKLIQAYMRKRLAENGYQEIHTPLMMDRSLWEKSGHWDKFAQHMFITESETRDYAVKPMNCPGGIQVYNQGIKSYRDLPCRLSEFGLVHRNEASGALHGLMRVRAFTQDDAHSFCTPEQVKQEVVDSINLILSIYKDFGFDEVDILLATRPELRIGEDAIWDQAEAALTDALNAVGDVRWKTNEGEGAFYGPKLEFSLKDSIGRVWQCGTIQLDFSMPKRLGAEYVSEQGCRLTPVMIHRAIFGSFERFIAILLEHYAGKLPVWLAPVQAVIINITDKQAEFCYNIQKILKNNGVRVNLDLRNEKIGFKIRQHTLERASYLLIIGDKEVEADKVSVRTLDGEDLGQMSVDDFVNKVKDEVKLLGELSY